VIQLCGVAVRFNGAVHDPVHRVGSIFYRRVTIVPGGPNQRAMWCAVGYFNTAPMPHSHRDPPGPRWVTDRPSDSSSCSDTRFRGVVGIDAHVNLGRLRVLGGVGEGFGKDVIGRGFSGFGQPFVDT
jgi:hypothetical protein